MLHISLHICIYTTAPTHLHLYIFTYTYSPIQLHLYICTYTSGLLHISLSIFRITFIEELKRHLTYDVYYCEFTLFTPFAKRPCWNTSMPFSSKRYSTGLSYMSNIFTHDTWQYERRDVTGTRSLSVCTIVTQYVLIHDCVACISLEALASIDL